MRGRFSIASFLLGVLACMGGIVAVGLYARASAETWLTLPCCSYHLDRHRGYNEFNYGVGVEHQVAPGLRLGAGTFQNSLRRASNYVGGVYAPLELGPARIGTSFGMISGYTNHAIPMLTPTVMLEHKGVGLNIILIPPIDHGRTKTSGVVGFQIKVRLD